MRRSVSHFLCLLIIGWQAFASAVSAQDLMLCLHKDGASRIENKADQRICSYEQRQQRAPDATRGGSEQWTAGGEHGCVDMPLPAMNAAAQTTVSHQVDVTLYVVDLPVFLRTLTLPIPAGVAFHGDVTDTDRLQNDVALDALSGIVLVI